MKKEELAKMIDHTLLRPEATEDDIKRLCKEARQYGFGAVCVNPCHVPLAKKLLKGADVKVCTVVGFPLGASRPAVKIFETKQAVADGADEIDMVMNIGALKSQKYKLVKFEIKDVVMVAEDRPVKVIIETCLLSDNEKKLACKLVKEAGAAFVKTSTGFSRGGATVKDVKLMRKLVESEMGVKAAGGIKTLKDALVMIKAGANRLGTSSGVKIMKGLENKSRQKRS